MDWKNRSKCSGVSRRSRYVHVAVKWLGNTGKDGRTDQGRSCAGGTEERGSGILCAKLHADGDCICCFLWNSFRGIFGWDDRLLSAEQYTGHTGCKAVSDDHLRSGHIFIYESDFYRHFNSDGK